MLRAAIVSGLAMAAIAAVPAHANDVTPSCKLNNVTTVDCSTWHSSSVTLRWSWDPGGETAFSPECATVTFTSDTPATGTSRKCTVSWGPVEVSYTATVRVDKTPPSVVSAAPARAADQGGW